MNKYYPLVIGTLLGTFCIGALMTQTGSYMEVEGTVAQKECVKVPYFREASVFHYIVEYEKCRIRYSTYTFPSKSLCRKFGESYPDKVRLVVYDTGYPAECSNVYLPFDYQLIQWKKGILFVGLVFGMIIGAWIYTEKHLKNQ